ncbi:GWxTD domain-containing protein [candidate division KSB1 bacterium]|nr:GWxTD domain-containing protein [candidate division KSB1 bacterium]
MSVSLPPGEYYYVVKIIENNIPEILVEKTKINLRPFQNDRLHISDIVFVDKIDCEDDPVIFKPNLKSSFDESQSDFTAYLILYPQKNSDSLTIEYKISNVDRAQIFQKSETLAAANNRIPYCIPFKDVIKKPGQYYLSVKVKSGKQAIDNQKIFHVNWSNVKLQQNNLDLAIEQLKMIAHKDIISKIKEAPESEKKDLYDQFWKERDPTTDTPENELKTEFFQRINFANQNFAESFPYSNGWETDRGEIYIKYGPPTQVERQQAELSNPGIEIWYYANIDRKYYFADRNGNGSYRLVKVE